MDSVSLIEAALAAGASASTQETASQAVKDAYAGLKALIQKRFASNRKAEIVLIEYEIDQSTWKKPLQKSLIETGADQDEALLRHAQQVLILVSPQQASQGKYNINIGEAKGYAIGDNAQVENTWNEKYDPPPGEPPDIPLPPKPKPK